MGFGQVAASSQFYLYGRRYCTATGYAKARAALLKEGPDLLESADLSLVVTRPLHPTRHTHRARRARHPPASFQLSSASDMHSPHARPHTDTRARWRW